MRLLQSGNGRQVFRGANVKLENWRQVTVRKSNILSDELDGRPRIADETGVPMLLAVNR